MKRGSSHVEMILSFVIFMAAIGFALYFFRPGGDRLVESSFDYLFREIEENASSKVLIYSVRIYSTSINENTIALDLSGADEGFLPEAYKDNGEIIGAKREGDLIYLGPTSWGGVEFVSIILSEEFLTSGGGSEEVNYSYYNISSSISKTILSENKLKNLSSYYSQNYTILKKNFNIPGRVNFGFVVNLSDGEIKGEREIPKNLEVFVEEKKIEVLRENGKIEFAELMVKVW